MFDVGRPGSLSGATPATSVQVVLTAAEINTERVMRGKTERSIPPWLLHQFLPCVPAQSLFHDQI